MIVQNKASQLAGMCVVAKCCTDGNINTLLNCGAAACARMQGIEGGVYADLNAMG